MNKLILLFLCFFIYASYGAEAPNCLEDKNPRTRLIVLESRRDQEEPKNYDNFLTTTEEILSILADSQTPSFSLENPDSFLQPLFSLCRSRYRLSGRPALFSGASLGDSPDSAYLERLRMLVIVDALVANSFRHEEFYGLWAEAAQSNNYTSVSERLMQHISEFQLDVPFDPATIDHFLKTESSRNFFNTAFQMQNIFAAPIFVGTYIESFASPQPVRGWEFTSGNSAWAAQGQPERVPMLQEMNRHSFVRINSTLGRGTREGDNLVVDYLLVPWVTKDSISPIKFRLERRLSSIQESLQDFAYRGGSPLVSEAKQATYMSSACLKESHWHQYIEKDLYEAFLPLGDPLIQFHYAIYLEDLEEAARLPDILENFKRSADQGCPWAQNNYARLLVKKDPRTASLYLKLSKEAEKRE